MRIVFASHSFKTNPVGELARHLIQKTLCIFLRKPEHIFQAAQKRMLAAAREVEIFGGIVQLVPVAMVDDFVARQLASDHLLHDDAMLSDGSAPAASSKYQISPGDAALTIGTTLTFVGIAVALESSVVKTTHAESICRTRAVWDTAPLATIHAAVSTLAVVASATKRVLDEVRFSIAILCSASHNSHYSICFGANQCA